MNYISIVITLIVTVCSLKNNNNVERKKTRIIGGLVTQPRQKKYLVGVFRNGLYICGGGIIGQKYIVTAAHCVVNKTTNELKDGKFKIVAGSDNLNIKTPFTIEIAVERFYVPIVYNGTFWDHELYPKGDIAVLELKRKLDLTNNEDLQKLELPSRDVKFAPNDDVYKKFPSETAGFGKDNFTYYTDRNGKLQMDLYSSRKLLKAKVQIIDRATCQMNYSGYIWNSTLCGRVVNYSNGTHQGICRGDSGSPLVQNGTVVIGVISGSSKNCNDNKRPGIYTKIASFKKFIKNVKQGITDNMRVLN